MYYILESLRYSIDDMISTYKQAVEPFEKQMVDTSYGKRLIIKLDDLGSLRILYELLDKCHHKHAYNGIAFTAIDSRMECDADVAGILTIFDDYID